MQVLDHHGHEEEASTCSYSIEGFSIPYFAVEKEKEGVHFHAFTDNKSLFRFTKILSIRNRGRSSPFASLVRKLGRFKVRYVLVQDPSNDNH